MPSVAAALWVQEEQARVARLQGREAPAEIAERAWDAGRALGVTQGRAAVAAPALPPDLAALVAALRGALAGGDIELRAAVEGALADLTNPTRPEPRANAAPGLSLGP